MLTRVFVLFAAVLLVVSVGRAIAQEATTAATVDTKPATEPASKPAKLTPEEIQQVKDALEKIKPNDPGSADVAENTIVELGKKDARLLAVALRNAIKSDNEEQITPVVDAMIRVRLGVDPRKQIFEWVKKQPKWEKEDVEAKIRPQAIMNEALMLTGPKSAFYLVRFRMYPVARMVQPPLGPVNIFAMDVSKKGDLTLITDAAGLKEYVAKTGFPVKNTDQAKVFVQGWLRLSRELVNDGMLHFTIDMDSIKAQKKDDGTIEVSAKAVVESGGKGDLEVTLTFDKDGKLTDVKETKNIKQGMRPKCQATKLLDKDDIVRYMARESLLLMGTDVHDYIFEQRAKASPELKKAIDEVWQEILRDEHRFPRKK